MAISFEEIDLDGSTNVVTVPFPYLHQLHVHVFENNVEVSAGSLTWLSGTEIRLPNPAASYAGKRIRRQRITPSDAPLVIFQPGSLDEEDLNRVALQMLYVAQEAADNAELILAGQLGAAVDQAEAAAVAAIAARDQVQAVVDAALGSGPVSIVASDLGGAGFPYDLGVLSDPTEELPGYAPDGYIRTVAENMTSLQAVVADLANISAVTAQLVNIAALGPHAADLGALAPYGSAMASLAANLADLAALAPVASDIGALGPISAHITALAAISADISYVAANGGVPPDLSVTTSKLAAAAVTNAKAANMAQATIKLRQADGGTGSPEDGTADQAETILGAATRRLFPLGAAATPGLTPVGDTNTGIWSPGADTLAWSTNGTERMRLLSGGALVLGGTAELDGNGYRIQAQGISSFVAATGQVPLYVVNTGGSSQTAMLFRQGGPPLTCGSITMTGASVTAYNTSSDYRLKTRVKPLDGAEALRLVEALSPVTHGWAIAPELPDMPGFLAHEVQALLPHAVTGTKDGPGIQQLDYSKLVVHLVAAVQQISKDVSALKRPDYNTPQGAF